MIASITYFPHAGSPEYNHHINQSAPTSDTPVLYYENLSTEGKRAFQLALLNETGHAAIREGENKPAEFLYSDYARPGDGMYVIRYDGTDYHLTAMRGSTYAGWVPKSFGTVGGGLLVLSGSLFHRGMTGSNRTMGIRPRG
jgi:hypothetical protein